VGGAASMSKSTLSSREFLLDKCPSLCYTTGMTNDEILAAIDPKG